jgi:hypothetical protein
MQTGNDGSGPIKGIGASKSILSEAGKLRLHLLFGVLIQQEPIHTYAWLRLLSALLGEL